MLRRAFALLLVAVLAVACTPKGKHSTHGSSSRPRTSSSRPASSGPSARSVLTAYLDATFNGRHARGWSLLTRADQARVSRAAYIEEQRDLARMRSQVEALGKSRRKINAVNEREDRASATVVLTSGLGRELVRFVLRREKGQWRVDYASSWSPAN